MNRSLFTGLLVFACTSVGCASVNQVLGKAGIKAPSTSGNREASSARDVPAVRDAAQAVAAYVRALEGDSPPVLQPLFVDMFWVNPAADLAQSPRHRELQAQLVRAEQTRAGRLGARAEAIIGDGVRQATESAALVDAARELVEACTSVWRRKLDSPEALAGFEGAEKVYAAKLDATVRRTPAALTYAGAAGWDDGREHVGSARDARSALLFCEAKIAEQRAKVSDRYVPEGVAEGAVTVSCGKQDYVLVARKIGGEWDTYGVAADFPSEKIPCSAIPKASKGDAEVKAWLQEIITPERKDDRVVQTTGIDLDEDSSTFPPTPLRRTSVTVYSRKMPLTANACGEENLDCEANGSPLPLRFNALRFHLDRAEHWRVAGKPEQCREQMNLALENEREFRWVAGQQHLGLFKPAGRYRLRDGAVLRGDALKQQAEALAAEREKRGSGYCDAKSPREWSWPRLQGAASSAPLPPIASAPATSQEAKKTLTAEPVKPQEVKKPPTAEPVKPQEVKKPSTAEPVKPQETQRTPPQVSEKPQEAKKSAPAETARPQQPTAVPKPLDPRRPTAAETAKPTSVDPAKPQGASPEPLKPKDAASVDRADPTGASPTDSSDRGEDRTAERDEPLAPHLETQRASPAPSDSSRWRPASYVLLGVGAAGLGAGAVFGALSRDSSARSLNRDEHTWAQAQSLRSTSAQQASLANTLFIAGGAAALAGGVTFIFTMPQPGEPQ